MAPLNELHWAWQIAIATLLVIGGVFSLVGAIGMLRFSDFFMRLHAPTKATTLGVGGVLLASLAVHWTQGGRGLHELLITLFLFVTAPVSANLLAKAGLHLKLPSQCGLPADPAAAEASAKASAEPR
ncbi:Na+/H+ antiporter subunit G [Roseateles koreensis]|uniref:Na+/H+ antiporter subunit G n=1 Tax=Roseateles koreensis TaxID=2987526 RepID=A0ABT5KVL2_9BURK|nr:Na+/H+ antiporter subunit G [Roseateles koreensis]MDC8786973.1 Na+/H+ antiporter subunit G [Roseateles koreensis]